MLFLPGAGWWFCVTQRHEGRVQKWLVAIYTLRAIIVVTALAMYIYTSTRTVGRCDSTIVSEPWNYDAIGRFYYRCDTLLTIAIYISPRDIFLLRRVDSSQWQKAAAKLVLTIKNVINEIYLLVYLLKIFFSTIFFFNLMLLAFSAVKLICRAKQKYKLILKI